MFGSEIVMVNEYGSVAHQLARRKNNKKQKDRKEWKKNSYLCMYLFIHFTSQYQSLLSSQAPLTALPPNSPLLLL